MTAEFCGIICAAGAGSASRFVHVAIPLLLLLLVAAAAALRLLSHRSARLLKELKDEKQARGELASFLSRFASGLRGDEGFEGLMHTTALNVAEKIDAKSVCIYEFRNEEFIGAGVCGNYPLIHTDAPQLLTRRQQLLEVLLREKIVAGIGFPGSILVSKQPELIPDAAADPRFGGYADADAIGSVMAVPMLRDGMITGIVCACGNRARPAHAFSQQQLERLRRLSSEIMMVQDLVRVYFEISRRDRIDQELEFARHIQTSLLPASFPQWGNFAVSARTRSAKEVNGDYYDFVRIDDDRLLVVIGDACGKGVPASMLTAMTRSFANALGDSFTTLTAFLRDLNRKLFNDTGGDRFITVGCCLLNRRASLLEFGRAGHTNLITFVHNHIRVISPDGNALGILPDEFVAFETLRISLDPGSTVMMYTDGLTEATNALDEEFGEGRLIEAFSESCARRTESAEIIDDLMNAVSRFEREQSDDQTVVLIRRTGDGPAQEEPNHG